MSLIFATLNPEAAVGGNAITKRAEAEAAGAAVKEASGARLTPEALDAAKKGGVTEEQVRAAALHGNPHYSEALLVAAKGVAAAEAIRADMVAQFSGALADSPERIITPSADPVAALAARQEQTNAIGRQGAAGVNAAHLAAAVITGADLNAAQKKFEKEISGGLSVVVSGQDFAEPSV